MQVVASHATVDFQNHTQWASQAIRSISLNIDFQIATSEGVKLESVRFR